MCRRVHVQPRSLPSPRNISGLRAALWRCGEPELGGCGRRAASRAGNNPQGHVNISLVASIRQLCREISPKSLKTWVKCETRKRGSDSRCLALISAPALVQSGTKAVPHFASCPCPPELWGCVCRPLFPQEGYGNVFPLVPPLHPGEEPLEMLFFPAKGADEAGGSLAVPWPVFGLSQACVIAARPTETPRCSLVSR